MFEMRLSMAKMAKKNDNGRKAKSSRAVTDYVARLSTECRMLVVLKAQLYGGSWQDMLDDLNNRLEGKPYIFKLVNRIKDDIDRIREMQDFENKNDVDLADYVDLP